MNDAVQQLRGVTDHLLSIVDPMVAERGLKALIANLAVSIAGVPSIKTPATRAGVRSVGPTLSGATTLGSEASHLSTMVKRRRKSRPRRPAASLRTADPEWPDLKTALRTALGDRGQTIAQAAAAMGIASSTLTTTLGRLVVSKLMVERVRTYIAAGVPEVTPPAEPFPHAGTRSGTHARANGAVS